MDISGTYPLNKNKITHKGGVNWIIKETGYDNPKYLIAIQKPQYKLISPVFKTDANDLRIFYDTWMYKIKFLTNKVIIKNGAKNGNN